MLYCFVFVLQLQYNVVSHWPSPEPVELEGQIFKELLLWTRLDARSIKGQASILDQFWNSVFTFSSGVRSVSVFHGQTYCHKAVVTSRWLLPVLLHFLHFPFWILSDTFIQSDLLCVKAIHDVISMCVNWYSNQLLTDIISFRSVWKSYKLKLHRL